MAEVDTKVEGWSWLHNARKWHYFIGSKSVCRKFLILAHPSEGYQVGNDNSPDNCVACKRLRAKVNGGGES